MNNFDHIQQKLHNFVKKYYTNEILKGSILFLSFGLLYFIFTLFIEYFLWLKPISRTILFWLFVFGEFGLLTKFIIIPMLKLIGLQKGISFTEASKIIGRHFKEVDDKLLNILQLNASGAQTDLLLASIEQKAKNLQPIPFKNAITFHKNIKYVKYLIVPLVIWLTVLITGHKSVFTQSLDRVVHHRTAYSPPAPFSFKILNKKLQTIEGKSFSLQVVTIGDIIPEDVRIHFGSESYYLNRLKTGELFYDFESPIQDVDFYLEANNVTSNDYTLEVIAAPKIIDFKMELNYPEYIKKESELIRNTGNANIPEGTRITWKISSENTKTINFVTFNKGNNSVAKSFNTKKEELESKGSGEYEITKSIKESFTYQINTSNDELKKFEELNYQLQVVKDQYPKIFVKSDIDSVRRGPVQFVGQLTDDYSISKLQVVAKNLKSKAVSIGNIKINSTDFEEFFYVFPRGLILDEGVNYEIHFEVFDNDAINGRKKAISQSFYYNSKTQQEIEQELLLEQKQSIEDIENSTKNSDDIQKSLEDFSKKLKSKDDTDWNDKKQFNQFLERQKNYQEMLQRNSDKLLENLEEMDDEDNLILEEKKQSLKDRIKEAKELQDKEDLLKELQELAEKLKKEDLLEKIDKLKEQNKQEKRSLERILELTKRFYVEKKSDQIVRKLDKLSEEQTKLSNDELNSSEEQKKLNQQFDSIQKDFDELNKQNKDLKQPMDIQDTKADQKLIEMDMKSATDNLENSEKGSKDDDRHKQSARQKQKSAGKKMKELSERMQADFQQMEMETNEENIKDLQQILENLLIFSFDQEELMLSFNDLTSKNAEYPEKLKQQIKLKEHFEHIDDSLYALSLRLERLSTKIQKDLTETHYNLDKSLENITENRISQGISNQQYTMTAANNLADLLSNMLQNLQNKKPGSGKGKGKKGEEISLPDIIKQQKDLVQKLKSGTKQGKTEGEKNKEQMSGEQFQIYKEQSRLKEQLRDLMNKNPDKSLQGKKVLQQMEQLEKLLLEKGLTNETLQRMQQLEHELLKLETASMEQNKDSKRKSDTNKEIRTNNKIKELNNRNLYFKENELLIRQNLMLQPEYQNRIKKYFQKEN